MCKLKDDQGDCQLCKLSQQNDTGQHTRTHYETIDNQHREKILRVLYKQDYIEQ